MKIAFAGTECTGKSTLSKALADVLGIAHVPDPYMEVIALYPEMREWWNSKDPTQQWAFEKEMHYAQFSLEQGKESFVADSASYVRAACALVYCDFVAAEELRLLVQNSILHGDVYDIILHLPDDIPYVDNGHRLLNSAIRYNIQVQLKTMLDTHCSHKTVHVQRFATIDDTVKELERRLCNIRTIAVM